MRFAVSILGTEVFAVSTETEWADTSPGDCISMPVGFTASAPDQRWEAGVEFR